MNTQLHSLVGPARIARALTHLLARRACPWAALGCAALLGTVTPPAQAAVVSEAWVHGYNGPANGDDYAAAVAVDGSGNVVVAGSSEGDYYTAKYAASTGALLWEKRYNGLDNGGGYASAVAVDDNGNVVVTGISWYPLPNFAYDYYTAKYAAADGTLLWEKRHMAQANRGDFGPTYPPALAVVGSGDVVVTGYSDKLPDDVTRNIPFNDYTAKYAAADGALLWEKTGSGVATAAVAVDGNGKVVVTGSSTGGCYTAKYAAADGALLWEKTGPVVVAPAAVAADGNGNVVLTGSFSVGVDPNTFNTLSDYYTAKYAAADGRLLWEQRYHGPANYDDQARAVAVDGSGNVVVTGGSGNGAPNYDHDYYTARYAANGALLWEKRYHGPANADDAAQAVAVDGSGDVVVAGNSFNGSGNADYYTAKYSAADGALLWEKRYNGPADGNDIVGYSRSLALGPNGVVAVTGSSYGEFGPNSPDFATVVYRENQPPVITCPANQVADFSSGDGAVVSFTVTATDESSVPPTLACAPPSDSVFPIGQTTVTCTATGADSPSSTCSFTVTVLGARGVKEKVLAELTALRATVRERDDGRKLAETIGDLTQSLAAELWVDQTHLERKHGEQVFHEDKEAIKQLCNLIKSRKSRIPDAVLQEFVDRIFRADRLLAAVAIQDAIAAGVPVKQIEQAQKFLAKGDAEAGDDNCANRLEDYRNAWILAIRP